MDPLKYGKVVFNENNIYIIWISTKTLVVISKFDLFNEVKFYRDGDFRFSYNDHKINDSTFIRTVGNKQFTFENNILINISSRIN